MFKYMSTTIKKPYMNKIRVCTRLRSVEQTLKNVFMKYDLQYEIQVVINDIRYI